MLYYVDFCHKYGRFYDTASSLDAFLVKLQEKKQSTILRQQAQEAIALYFEMLGSRKTPSQADRDKIADKRTMASIPNRQEVIRSETQSTAKSWVWVYEKLEEQIRVRHYSDKTLKSYRGWVRQLQSYVISKSASDLSIEDVKAFLSFLAVEKKVSASSQNQAFNGLLFLFRNVLGREFGKVDGVVRAKQRKNIPIVLSREEIDRVLVCLNPPYDLVAKLLYGCRSAVSERLRRRF